jgi:3-isopropylmalate dehydrogenase
MQLWTDHIPGFPRRPNGAGRYLLGVLPGEGVGPEVTRLALDVLAALQESGLAPVDVRTGGGGIPTPDEPLPAALADFCAGTFAAGGAVLAGPYGGRFVYEMRRRFDLFCKFNPLRPSPALRDAGRLRPEAVAGVDVLVVRENVGGIYQGNWRETETPDNGRLAEHSFSYSETQVRRILEVSARIAATRRRRLAVVAKPGGMPSIHRLWRDCAEEIAAAAGVECTMLDVDYAAYRLLQHAGELDVVVAPNLAADVLCDVGAVLLGGRGLSFGGSFADGGAAVYQTNHGAAYDLAGTDRVNPVGHVLALAMALRQSFGLADAASAVERAIDDVWAEGARTADLAAPGAKAVGTAELGERIIAALTRGARRPAEPRLAR